MSDLNRILFDLAAEIRADREERKTSHQACAEARLVASIDHRLREMEHKIMAKFSDVQVAVKGLTDKIDALLPKVDALIAKVVNGDLPGAQELVAALQTETAAAQAESDKVDAAVSPPPAP